MPFRTMSAKWSKMLRTVLGLAYSFVFLAAIMSMFTSDYVNFVVGLWISLGIIGGLAGVFSVLRDSWFTELWASRIATASIASFGIDVWSKSLHVGFLAYGPQLSLALATTLLLLYRAIELTSVAAIVKERQLLARP